VGAPAAREISPAAIVLAEEEGLTAHAEAIRLRLRDLTEGER